MNGQELAHALLVHAGLTVTSITSTKRLAFREPVRPGDGVLIPSMTFAATAEIVRYLGAIPILVDSDPVTLNMSLEALDRTAHAIGPAVVLTTMVLALGLGVTMLSDLPSLRLFGRLAGVCLAASLIGQLVILPGSIVLWRRWFPLQAGTVRVVTGK